MTTRPWGRMCTLLATKKFWIKALFVHGATSYQSHNERTEWVVGVFKVLAGQKHRYTRGVYLEVATGLPREDDIVRYEDDYNRV